MAGYNTPQIKSNNALRCGKKDTGMITDFVRLTEENFTCTPLISVIVKASVCLLYFFYIHATTETLLYNIKPAHVVSLLLFTADNDYLLYGKIKYCQGNPIIVSKVYVHMNREGSNYK